MLRPPVVGHCRTWCVLLNPACCHVAQPSPKAHLIVRMPDQPPTIPDFGSCMSNATDPLRTAIVQAWGPAEAVFGTPAWRPAPRPHIRRHRYRIRRRNGGGSSGHRAGSERTWAHERVLRMFSARMPRTYHGVECWILRFDSRMHGGSASFCANLRATGRCHDGFRSAAKYRIGIALRLAC